MMNLQLYDNVASNGGGAYFGENSNAILNNSTLAFNRGYGVVATTPSIVNATIVNSILWDNSGAGISSFTGTQNVSVTYCDVQTPGVTGAGNIIADPLFLNVTARNLRLNAALSPCIDAGDTTSTIYNQNNFNDNGLDLDNDPTTTFLVIDLDGTYRFIEDGNMANNTGVPNMTISGVPLGVIVDMGCFEANPNGQ